MESTIPLMHLITYIYKALSMHHSICFLLNTFNLSTLAIPMPPAFAHLLLLKYISNVLKLYFSCNICPPSLCGKTSRMSFLLISTFGNSLNCGFSSHHCCGLVTEGPASLLIISDIISFTSQV